MSGPGPHLGDVLSALADGELGPAEVAAARRHLDTCAACRDELAAVEVARAAVRSLPPVTPPAGWLEALAATRPLVPRRGRPLVASAAAVAAACVLVAGVGAGTPASRTAPPFATFLAGHEDAGTGPVDGTTFSPASLGTTATVDVPGPWPAPSALVPGWPLVAAVERGDSVQLVYSDGTGKVSVFEQRGRLDDDRLPAGVAPVTAGGRQVWGWGSGGDGVAVYEDGELVVTVVADGSASRAVQAAGLLPAAPAPSLADRARRACQGLVDVFSLRG